MAGEAVVVVAVVVVVVVVAVAAALEYWKKIGHRWWWGHSDSTNLPMPDRKNFFASTTTTRSVAVVGVEILARLNHQWRHNWHLRPGYFSDCNRRKRKSGVWGLIWQFRKQLPVKRSDIIYRIIAKVLLLLLYIWTLVWFTLPTSTMKLPRAESNTCHISAIA